MQSAVGTVTAVTQWQLRYIKTILYDVRFTDIKDQGRWDCVETNHYGLYT